MKFTVRFLSVLLAAIMLLSFAACSAQKEDVDLGMDNSENEPGGSGNSAAPPTFSKPDSGDNIYYGGMPEGVTPEGGTNEGPSSMGGVGDDEAEQAPVFDENDFISTDKENISTFSADVDTASYTYFRKLVNSGYSLSELIGAGASFRTEEFINYFDYRVNQPKDNELFGVTTSIVDCPWNEDSLLMRLTLQAEDAVESCGNNLVFLIDVSGSMRSEAKLPLLKKTFSYLVENLNENDVISIVTYSGKEEIVLDGCAGNKDEMIISAINGLVASGSTNGEAGLTEAYRLAEKHYIEGGNNRIIMASDGDLNVGISSADQLEKYISQKRDQGVYLSVLGFGTGNYRDANMEALADNGNGVYYYIDGESEAERVLGTDLLGTLYTVAEDVKLQITFDKDYISEYRLIGYENRLLNKEDFEDDTKDAGEVGAGHQVTVCYEIKLCEGALIEDALATLAVRYKKPGETISRPNDYKISGSCEEQTEDTEFLLCVIQTCMILHRSEYIGDVTLGDILARLNSLDLSDYPEREEFRALIDALV